MSLVSKILDPFWALPFMATAITYFNALICIYWLVYNKIRDKIRDRYHPVIACSIWRHIDLGVMGPMRVEGSQSRHHHHPTQLMTGVLEHACAKYALCSL